MELDELSASKALLQLCAFVGSIRRATADLVQSVLFEITMILLKV